MFSSLKLFSIFCMISFIIIPSSAHLTNMGELRRQYADYRNIFKKTDAEPVNGFENFVQNLNRIEDYNKDYSSNGGCKLFLTKHSDTDNEQSSYKTCKNIQKM